MVHSSRWPIVLCFWVAMLIPAAGVAQLPSPSAAALGMGENRTAAARGYSAVSSNPAALAVAGGPISSATVLTARAEAGLGPIGLGDLAEFDGREIPHETRQRWLDRITRAGGEEGSAGAELTYFAAQVGRFGVQLSTSAEVLATLGPGAAELVLFGNAGRTGEPADITVRGSELDVGLLSTVAVGYGHPLLSSPERSLSLGATLKYTLGHAMLTGVAAEGGASAAPVEIGVEFPIVQSDSAFGPGSGHRGSGVGLDVGVVWREGAMTGGLVVQNLFNTFSWDEEELLFRPGAISVTEDASGTDFDLRPLDEAPGEVLSRVEDQRYAPVIAAGLAYGAREDLLLTGDLRHRFGDARHTVPATHLGAGAEYRPVRWLPLRAGGAIISDGYLFSAGVGLDLSPFRIDAAAARRRTELGPASLVMVAVSLERR